METRATATLALSVATGCGLFFMAFASVFNGLWALLIVCLVCYPGVAVVAVGLGRARPVPVAVALVSPTLPWLLWLLPAAIVEAGLLRAAVWPLAVGLVFVLAWLAGWIVARLRARSSQSVARDTHAPVP
jgi:hypothetical protein